MRGVAFLFLLALSLFANTVTYERWPKGETLLSFLSRNGIDAKLYYQLDGEEKELASEIRAGVKYIENRDEQGRLAQVLVPINEELQLHLYKKRGRYILELTPINYQIFEDAFGLVLSGSPYVQIQKATNNVRLAHAFVRAFKHSVDFTRIHKGDRIAVIYKQKVRLGDYFGMPDIKAAAVQIGRTKRYVFEFDERYFDERGRELEKFMLIRPIPGARITSRFTRKRWHPVLHRYRAHLGVDFGARRGTPIRAAGNGRITFCGRKGGYGNVIIINHGGGYKTLYAHMSRFRHGMRRGKYVKQGQVIGYVGSTGLSTGPHLHFGLYRGNRAINPLRVVHIAKSRLSGKKLRLFRAQVKRYKTQLDKLLRHPKEPLKIEPVKKSFCKQGGENAKG